MDIINGSPEPLHSPEQPQQVDQVISLTYMDRDLLEAAKRGKMKLFNEYQGDLRYLLDDQHQLNTALHVYSRFSKGGISVNFMEQLLKRCPSLLGQVNFNGETPLHVAVECNNDSIVKFIINHIKRPQDNYEEDLENGTLEASNYTIKQMLETADKEGNTPLHKAADRFNSEKVAQLLVLELDSDFSFSANNNGETPIFIAVRRRNLRFVEILLDNCSSLSIDQFGGPKGTTALHLAALMMIETSRYSYYDGPSRLEMIISKLIETKKELIKEADDQGRAPLHYAAYFGHYSMVRMMLEKDESAAFIADKERGATALHMAAWQGDLDTMEKIITCCPDCCTIADNKGWNFLHFAFLTLSEENLARLLEIELAPDHDNFSSLPIRDLVLDKNENGNTPLHIMRFGPAYMLLGDSQVKSYFLRFGWSENEYTSLYQKEKIIKQQILKSLKEIHNIQVAGRRVDCLKSPLLCQDSEDATPLHAAAKLGNLPLVRYIIEYYSENELDLEYGTSGATNNMIKQMLFTKDTEGNTPLHKAAEYGFQEMAQLLVQELGHDFSFSTNDNSETPIYIAAKKGDLSFAEIILKCCKSISSDFGGPEGTTALHAAVMVGHSGITESLIKEKRELIEKPDDRGRTPLHYAAHCGQHDIVKVLLRDCPSAAHIKDKERGSTALHMAAWQGEIKLMEEIITCCPDCHMIEDDRGWNFLHFALVVLTQESEIRTLLGIRDDCGNRFKSLNISELLEQKDENGNTPLHVMRFGPAYLRLGDYQVKRFCVPFGVPEAVYASLDQKRKVRKSLKEIGCIQVANVPVHNNFHIDMEEEERKMKIEEKKETLEDIEVRDIHLLVVALVATVTFAAAYTVPGGYNEGLGTAIIAHNSVFKAFIVTDTLAFFSSLLAIFIHFLLVHFRRRSTLAFQIRWIYIADGLALFAMLTMGIAFSTGAIAVLQFNLGLTIAICGVLSLVGVVLCIYYFFCKPRE